MKSKLRKRQLNHTLNFTLLELLLVMVVMTIGLMGVTTVTTVGIDVGTDAIAKGIVTDASEQFLRFNAGIIRENDEWLEIFPDSQVVGDDSVLISESSGLNDSNLLKWSNTTLLENESMKIRFVTDQPNDPFDPEEHKENKEERSVFLYEPLTEQYSDYSISIRPWKEKTVFEDGSWEATLYVEASYPATKPYEYRHKEVYSVDFFNAPEIALADSAPLQSSLNPIDTNLEAPQVEDDDDY